MTGEWSRDQYHLTQTVTSDAQSSFNKFAGAAKGKYTVTSDHICMYLQLDTLASYGLKDTRLQYLTQGSAMGGAMLLGYIIGRSKFMYPHVTYYHSHVILYTGSHFKKIAYPVVGGAIVGGAIYMSDRGRQENCIQSLNKLLQRVWPSTRK